METLTERQRGILSELERNISAVAIPYIKCKKDDREVAELAEAGFVKIEQYDVDDEGEPCYWFSPNLDSPHWGRSSFHSTPQEGQIPP